LNYYRKYWVNNHAHIIKPIEGSFSYWANLLCIIEYSPWVTGSAQPKLSKDNLSCILLPLPPITEQQQIAHYLDTETQKIDDMITTVQQAIATLQEYRTALITAAVTGKIDVRGFNRPIKPTLDAVA